MIHDHHGCRITGKRPVSERVHLEQWNLPLGHVVCLPTHLLDHLSTMEIQPVDWCALMKNYLFTFEPAQIPGCRALEQEASFTI